MSEQSTRRITPFVDREAELKQLHAALHSVLAAGEPKVVLVQGDFGVGKTALVKHFLAEAAAQHSSLFIGEGKCALETTLNGLLPFS